MDHTTAEIRNRQWIQTIQEWSESGLTKRDYCRREGISEKQFYYYQRRIRSMIAEQELSAEENGLVRINQPQIVKLRYPGFTQKQEAEVRFTVNGKTMCVPENIPTMFLAKLLEAASHGTC